MSPADSASPNVKVSVAMITYDHEPFIGQAVEGVLMQQADFAVELVIGEDCSTDGTRTIVRDYADRYPHRIRTLLHDRNLGRSGMPNFLLTLEACRGKYIAMCEGDDYWTDPRKLHKQVGYLERNPGSAMCFHPVRVMQRKSDALPTVHYPLGRKRTYDLADWLGNPPAAMASIVFRRSFLEIPYWFDELRFAHRAFGILLAQRGPSGYIDETMAVYRSYGQGVFTSLDRYRQLQIMLQIRRQLRGYLALDARHLAILDEYTALDQLELGIVEYLRGQRLSAEQTLDSALTYMPPRCPVWLRRVVSVAARASETQTEDATGRDMVDWVAGRLAARGQHGSPRALWGEWYAAQAFRAHKADDRRAVRRFACAAFRSDLRTVRNRGLLSVAARAWLGWRVWGYGSRVVRRLTPTASTE